MGGVGWGGGKREGGGRCGMVRWGWRVRKGGYWLGVEGGKGRMRFWEEGVIGWMCFLFV